MCYYVNRDMTEKVLCFLSSKYHSKCSLVFAFGDFVFFSGEILEGLFGGLRGGSWKWVVTSNQLLALLFYIKLQR